MKIRSLLLGSVAAAGLGTAAVAADFDIPDVITALDACDALAKTGLTVSSDDTCLQISGEVKYEFKWGDYRGAQLLGHVATKGVPPGTAVNLIDNDGPPGSELDWESKVEWYLKFVATSDSDGGPVSAVIKIKEVQQWVTQNEAYVAGKNNPYTPGDDPLPGTGGDHTFGLIGDEAYVTVGDSTMLMMGKKGSIINKGDDEPFNFLGLFNSEKVDTGVFWSEIAVHGVTSIPDGGHVIQIVSDLGNGVSVGAGLEGLQNTGANAGTAVGVLAYAGEGITAHVTVVAAGVLDGTVEKYAVHAGATGTFDIIKVRAAVAADNSGYWNALASAEVAIDMFTLAGSVEAISDGDFGAGGSIGIAAIEGVKLNLGGRFYSDAQGPDFHQIAAQIVATVTENLTLTGEVGLYGNDAAVSTFYGAAELAYSPGGGFTSSIKGEAYSNGAYRATVKGAKTF